MDGFSCDLGKKLCGSIAENFTVLEDLKICFHTC